MAPGSDRGVVDGVGAPGDVLRPGVVAVVLADSTSFSLNAAAPALVSRDTHPLTTIGASAAPACDGVVVDGAWVKPIPVPHTRTATAVENAVFILPPLVTNW